jgi:hypothetical protein
MNITRNTEHLRKRIGHCAARLGAMANHRYSLRESTHGALRLLGGIALAGSILLGSGSTQRHALLIRYTITISARNETNVRAVHRLAGTWARQVVKSSLRYHMSPLLVAAVLHQENRGFIDRSAERVSGAGAIGPMQLMPGTAWNLLKANPWKPDQNIDAGTHYLAMLMRHYRGNVRLTLMAYNAGPTRIDRDLRNGRPAPIESVLYARRIMRRVTIERAIQIMRRPTIAHGIIEVRLASAQN